MGRSKVEACMLCGEVPCECNTVKPASARTAKPAVPVETPKPPSGAVAAMRAAARTSRRDRFLGRYTPPVGRPERPSDDALLASALRALSPILAENELDKYRVIITASPTLADRATVWRARHGYEES